MTETVVPPLVTSDDDGWAGYLARDPDWFLAAAGDLIRSYCNWHIWPSLSFTGVRCKIGARGIIPLPTLKLTIVDLLTVNGQTIPITDYTGYGSWIAWHPVCVEGVSQIGFDFTHPAGAYATVDFTHGYADIPPTVAELAYEIADRAMQFPAAAAVDVTAGPYRYVFGQRGGLTQLGISLSPDQKDRLAPYAIPGVS